MLGLEVLAGGKLDVAHRGLRAGAPGAGALAHADDADLCHVALQEGIGGLRGSVGDEDDVIRGDPVVGQDLVDRLDDACGDALRRVVGRWDLLLGNDLIGLVVHDDRIGEGASDVNANPDGALAHAVALLTSVLCCRDVEAHVHASRIASTGARSADMRPDGPAARREGGRTGGDRC